MCIRDSAYTAAAAALSGANVIYEPAGMYASLLGASPESLLLDNDVLGACLRMTKGLEVNEDTLSFENLKNVCINDLGHYLGTDETLSVMQSEYLYPDFGDRMSPDEWKIAGKQTPLGNAIQKKEEILANYHPSHISEELDQQIRDTFNIHLSREEMGLA